MEINALDRVAPLITYLQTLPHVPCWPDIKHRDTRAPDRFSRKAGRVDRGTWTVSSRFLLHACRYLSIAFDGRVRDIRTSDLYIYIATPKFKVGINLT